MAKLQLGVTHSNLRGQRQKSDAKTVTMCWFPSRKPLRLLSEFDKAEKQEPDRSGLLTSSGKSSISYTFLYSNKLSCRI